MRTDQLIQTAQSFLLLSPYAKVQKEDAISSELCGLSIFNEPLFAFGNVADPLFSSLKDEGAIGSHFMGPDEWLHGALTVISFFLPFTDEVKRSNALDDRWPSNEWLHARIEGQECIRQLCLVLKSMLESNGYRAVVPLVDPRFWSKTHPDYTSNWSERHVAFVCGLGTFGLSKGLITKAGIAGRFGSIITDAVFSVTQREYTGLYDYCIRCGSCVKRCPVRAITIEKGKLHPPCYTWVDKTHAKYSPRYGCGKCQVSVPCENGIPQLPRKTEPSNL